MKTRTTCALLLMALAGFKSDMSGEVLDRIVAIIDNTFIITQSDIRKERAIQTALGSKPQNDETLLDELVDKQLIDVQIDQFRDIEVSPEAVAQRMQDLGNITSVSRDDLREAVIAELRRNEFIIQRFRQFIRVSDAELLRYHEDVYIPALRQAGKPVPPVEQGLVEVRPLVIAEKLTEDVSIWLEDLRERSIVEKIH